MMKLVKPLIRQSLVMAVLMTWMVGAHAGPEIEHWTTDNGLKVYYVGAPDLPMLDLRIVFAAGSARDGDKPGLAMLTNGALGQGADGIGVDELAERFESVGAQFGLGSARDMGWATLRTLMLEKEKEAALSTWLKVLSKPDFPEKEFNNSKKLTLVGLQAEKQSPGSLGSKAFFREMYGDHPYAQPENGTEDSINAMTIADMQAFYKQYYVAKNAVLAIVGAVSLDEAKALSQRIAAVLPEGEKAAALPAVPPLKAAKTVRIPFPSEQSHILVGQPGNKRGDPDYFTLYLGNHVFGGGGFTSRLMEEIRNKRGLSYSVYSYFAPMQEFGPFELGLQTKLTQTDEALKVVREQLATYRKDGPSDKELEASKKDITGGFPLRTASNSSIVSYLTMIGFYDLPLDYLDTFTDKIQAISKEQIVDAYQRRVDPDKMLTVIVGGAAEESEDKKPEDGEKEQQADTPQGQ